MTCQLNAEIYGRPHAINVHLLLQHSGGRTRWGRHALQRSELFRPGLDRPVRGNRRKILSCEPIPRVRAPLAA